MTLSSWLSHLCFLSVETLDVATMPSSCSAGSWNPRLCAWCTSSLCTVNLLLSAWPVLWICWTLSAYPGQWLTNGRTLKDADWRSEYMTQFNGTFSWQVLWVYIDSSVLYPHTWLQASKVLYRLWLSGKERFKFTKQGKPWTEHYYLNTGQTLSWNCQLKYSSPLNLLYWFICLFICV